MNLGPAEILVIMIVALLVFGPTRLPEVGRQLGAAMRELRRMQANLRHELDDALHETPADTAPGARAAASRPAIEEPDHDDVPPAPPAPAAPAVSAGGGDQAGEDRAGATEQGAGAREDRAGAGGDDAGARPDEPRGRA